MLPIVAAMMMGQMSKGVSRQAAVPGNVGAGGSDLLGMLTPAIDANRDGSMVDDVMGLVGKFLGGRH
jgi:hypothetical protein